MDYLYDGTFEGLLTCIYHSYYENHAQGIYHQDNYQFSMLNDSKIINTDTELSAKVYEAINNKISPLALKQVYHVYLSNHPRKEDLILKYLQIGFRLGKIISGYHTHPDVLPVHSVSRKVSMETHRFYGLTRFRDTGRFLYASLEPDHNILVFLADHFADRLARENFVLHDKRRNIAAVYDKKEWYLTDFMFPFDFSTNETESFYQDLWTRYFSHISIESRINLRLQNQFVPKRYRKHIIEFTKPLLP